MTTDPLRALREKRPGVHRWSGDPTDLVEELEPAGWRIAILRGGATKRAFLSEVGDVLDFPAYYGENLDALWDCLRDLPGPTVLAWEGWDALATHHPRDWAVIQELLRERTQDQPSFAVVLVTAPRPGPRTARRGA